MSSNTDHKGRGRSDKETTTPENAQSGQTPLSRLQRFLRLTAAVQSKRESEDEKSSERLRMLEKDNARLREQIQQLSRREAYARYLANHDGLTGLSNRSLLMDRFVHAAAHAKRCGHPIALLLFDLDGFKAVNDRFGHLIGDKLLQRVAKRLEAIARAGDTTCRYGGDEFVMLVQGVDSAEIAEAVARRVREDIIDCLHVDGIQVDVTASCGIALYPEHGDNWNALMEAADKSMYQSKPASERAADRDPKHEQRWRSRHQHEPLLRLPEDADVLPLKPKRNPAPDLPDQA